MGVWLVPVGHTSRMNRPKLPTTEPFTTARAAALGYDRKALTRAGAARLVMSPELVLCDRTAAWLWGVDTFAGSSQLRV